MNIKIRCKIGELLKGEGRTQKWLAEQIDVAPQQMNSWCRESGSLPSIGYIMRIQKVTGWTLEQMFEEVEG
jgi:DNA-binding XRE family transcriptional regulator